MSGAHSDWKDELKIWLDREGFTSLINDFAIDLLVTHIEIELITPLKSEIKEIKGLNQHLQHESNDTI